MRHHGWASASHNGPVDHQQLSPAYRVPETIAWVDGATFGMAEGLYLTVVPDGRTVLLEGSARLIWLAACEGGYVIETVAGRVGLSAIEITEEVTGFLADLTDRGLLARVR